MAGHRLNDAAAHLIVDDDPPIFADTLAVAMLGERADELIGFHRANGSHPVLSGARAQVTCRSRYTENSLARAVASGISQYVILGAGLVPLHIASTVRTSDTANWLENRRRSSSCSSIPPMRGTETHNKFEITPWRAGVAAGIEEAGRLRQAIFGGGSSGYGGYL